MASAGAAAQPVDAAEAGRRWRSSGAERSECLAMALRGSLGRLGRAARVDGHGATRARWRPPGAGAPEWLAMALRGMLERCGRGWLALALASGWRAPRRAMARPPVGQLGRRGR